MSNNSQKRARGNGDWYQHKLLVLSELKRLDKTIADNHLNVNQRLDKVDDELKLLHECIGKCESNILNELSSKHKDLDERIKQNENKHSRISGTTAVVIFIITALISATSAVAAVITAVN